MRATTVYSWSIGITTPTVSRVAAKLRNKPQVHMHISAGDGARSGPRERVRCVAFAFIDLRPLAAVLQIHLLRYSRTPTRYKSIRDFSYETNS